MRWRYPALELEQRKAGPTVGTPPGTDRSNCTWTPKVGKMMAQTSRIWNPKGHSVKYLWGADAKSEDLNDAQ